MSKKFGVRHQPRTVLLLSFDGDTSSVFAMKKFLWLAIGSSYCRRENGNDVVSILKHEQTCDIGKLTASIDWECTIDEKQVKSCVPHSCSPAVKKVCHCADGAKNNCKWQTSESRECVERITSMADSDVNNKLSCTSLKDDWKCSKETRRDSVCTKKCPNGKTAVKKCMCLGPICAWRFKGSKKKFCFNKEDYNTTHQRERISKMRARELNMNGIDTEGVDPFKIKTLKLEKPLELPEGERRPDDNGKKSFTPTLEMLNALSPQDRKLITTRLREEIQLDAALLGPPLASLPKPKGQKEALLITSTGTTLSDNIGDIQENWIDFLIKLASFDKLTMITIDNGVMSNQL